jgi:CRISPR-associated protein Csm3
MSYLSKRIIMSNIQLKKKVIYTGIITLKTGLHIGGTNAALNIGGPDKFVVRNPLNNIPYIPGSSLKGKMRALIEIAKGCATVTNRGEVKASEEPDSDSGYLFGTAGKEDSKKRPSRIIIRDADMFTENDSDEELQLFGLKREDLPDFSNTDLPYTESKTEVSIDRATAHANPRTFERVPAGAMFKLNMIMNIFEGEDENKLKKTLTEAVTLLEDDYLGGQGSRGYGQIKIDIVKEDSKTY